MRKRLCYSQFRPCTDVMRYWDNTADILQNIPDANIYMGFEKDYTSWLSDSARQAIWTKTEDELSSYLSTTRDMRRIMRRPASERLVKFSLNLPSTMMSVGSIEKLASFVNNTPGTRIRTGPVFTELDDRGQRQEFIDPAEVPRAIQEFCALWNEAEQGNMAHIHIWLFVSFLNTHPFTDCNGRIARALLNTAFIRARLLKFGPIPFAPLIFATRGNFELAMGRGAILGDWVPIYRTFYILIRFYVQSLRRFQEDVRNA